jgi:hypothetical protein
MYLSRKLYCQGPSTIRELNYRKGSLSDRLVILTTSFNLAILNIRTSWDKVSLVSHRSKPMASILNRIGKSAFISRFENLQTYGIFFSKRPSRGVTLIHVD